MKRVLHFCIYILPLYSGEVIFDLRSTARLSICDRNLRIEPNHFEKGESGFITIFMEYLLSTKLLSSLPQFLPYTPESIVMPGLLFFDADLFALIGHHLILVRISLHL